MPAALCFFKWPWSAFGIKLSRFFPKPICSALYPSVSVVFIWTIGHGPAASSVTGVTRPCSSKIWVIPIFSASNPIMIVRASELDFDVDAGRKIELHQRVDRLGRGFHDVDEPLVDANLELLARFLVHVRRAQHRVHGALRRKRNRSRGAGAGALRRPNDLARRLIEHGVIVRTQTDADSLSSRSGRGHYWMISVT